MHRYIEIYIIEKSVHRCWKHNIAWNTIPESDNASLNEPSPISRDSEKRTRCTEFFFTSRADTGED